MTGLEAAARADVVARQRATLFYMMAGVLLLSTMASAQARGDQPLRVAIWLVMVALLAVNLLPVGGWLRLRRVTALLNDEGAREHRRTAFTVGFWTALASAAAVTTVASAVPLGAVLAGRVVITAALMAALIAFGTLELRAAR